MLPTDDDGRQNAGASEGPNYRADGTDYGVVAVSRSVLAAWRKAATDPDPQRDLGYEFQPLTVISAPEDAGVMFLPGDADHLTDEEFIVAGEDSVRSLDGCR